MRSRPIETIKYYAKSALTLLLSATLVLQGAPSQALAFATSELDALGEGDALLVGPDVEGEEDVVSDETGESADDEAIPDVVDDADADADQDNVASDEEAADQVGDAVEDADSDAAVPEAEDATPEDEEVAAAPADELAAAPTDELAADSDSSELQDFVCPLATTVDGTAAIPYDGDELPLDAQATVPGLDAEVNVSNALAILKAYDPDGYYMINYNIQQSDSQLDFWIQGGRTLAAALDTAVHEECHGYSTTAGGTVFAYNKLFWNEAIYIGNGKHIKVSQATKVNVFPTEEMSKLMPEDLRTFRFDTYISSGSVVSANVQGPFGLLNEFNAYSWGLNDQLNLFEYYRTQGQGTTMSTWRDFIGQCSSDYLAYAEFRYWTLRYLDYAKTNHKDVYDFFMSHQDYINAYCLTQSRFESELSEFEEKVAQIMAMAEAEGHSAYVDGGYAYIDGYGVGLVDSDFLVLMDEIEKPQYQAIDKALHAKQTVFKTDISSATVAPIPAQSYTGKDVTPSVTVTLNGKTLRKGSDYSISYALNKEIGTGYVTIAGRGDYIGGVVVDFEIKGYPFTDINGATPHLDDILWLNEQGISTGWKMGDGTRQFRPANTVVRQDMAAFLFRLAKLWGIVDDSWQPSGEVSFLDVDESTPHYREIMWLAESGVSAGWKVDGGREFRPTNTVVRQDMAAFLRRLQALRDSAVASWQPTGASPFRDVTSKTPHYDDILWLAESGVSAGWNVGGTKEFRPTNTVIRQDMAAFLHRLDGLG